MLLGSRLQDKWIQPPNNSQLEVHPSNEQIYSASTFLDNFNHHSQHFSKFLVYLRNPYERNKQMFLVTTKAELFQAVNELGKDDHLIIQTFNEKTISYKGYISWCLLANSNICYLIDFGTLHDEFYLIQHIFLDKKIIKLALNMKEVANNFKRDFGIFMINVFHLQWLEAFHPKLRQIKKQLNQDIESEIQKNCRILVQRPLSTELYNLVKRYFNMLMDHLSALPIQPQEKKSSKHSYETDLQYCYYNYNEQIILEHYEHKVEKFTFQYSMENFNMSQEVLINSLVDLRQHMAKMRDISPLLLLPNSILNEIVKENIHSVLQIDQLYQERKLNAGMEVYNRIYNTIQMNEEKVEDLKGLTPDFLQKYIPCTPAREKNSKDVKELLRKLEWGESSEWLNRKNDPSIRLYKQIVSINEFDESIFEEFVDSMKEEVLKKSELEKFLKYAEYMRGKNKQKLIEYYKVKCEQEKEDLEKQKKKKKTRRTFDQQFSNPSDYFMDEVLEHENEDDNNSDESPNKWNKKLFGDDDDDDLRDQEEEEMKTQENTFFKFSSKTSLEEKGEEKDFGFKFEKKKPVSFGFRKDSIDNLGQSSMSSRKSSDEYSSNMFSYEQEPERSSIKALPETIQEIYNQAIEAKKKIAKKSKKGKERKESRGPKKEIDFIPKENDIINVLHYKNNNLK